MCWYPNKICAWMIKKRINQIICCNGWEMVSPEKSTPAVALNWFSSTVKLLTQQVQVWIYMFLTEVRRRFQSWSTIWDLCQHDLRLAPTRFWLTGCLGSRATSSSVCSVSNTWLSRLIFSGNKNIKKSFQCSASCRSFFFFFFLFCMWV